MRNAEVIRQWSILRDLESTRGLTIDELAAHTGVTTRTIRRDLDALQEAGFPIFDNVYEGRRHWKLEQRAFRRLDATGFTLAELSALYFSRTLVECLAATPFERDVRSAFDKLAGALTPGMRRFLDRLPLALRAKPEPGSRAAPAEGMENPREVAARSTRIAHLLDAILHHRRVSMRYHSFSSNREKVYLIEPYRLVFAQGGLYLVAFVPEYGGFRTFSADRVLGISVTQERFDPVELEDDAFAHSLGVNQGTPPEDIEVRFEPEPARFVRERVWHPSQRIRDEPGGGVVLALRVSNDVALRSWILSFGSQARVLAPASLAAQISGEIERAARHYTTR